jgi:amidase
MQERIDDYGQDLFIQAQATNGIGKKEKAALENLARLKKKKLDALVTPDSDVSTILAVGGFPGIIVPAGFHSAGTPFGICFGGVKGSEPKLIEIAYGFEQATKIRKPPKIEV